MSDARTLNLFLVWDVRPSESDIDYHRFIHLLKADAAQPGGIQLLAQDDRTLCSDSHPPAQRQPGEKIIEEITLGWADDLPAGDYSVLVGLYELGAPARLTVEASGWPVRDNAVVVSQFTTP
jgi:hypothetical protein